MSYEIVKSINEKKRTITSACNNLRPLMYETCHYKPEMSVNEFRASVIVDLIFGNYHYGNKTHIYNIVASTVQASKEYEELEEKIWNWNNTYTNEWTHNHYEENIAELKQLVIKTFEELKDKPKEVWIITDGYCHIKRINKWTYSYCTSKEKALKFGTELSAQASAKALGKYWYAIKLADKTEAE